jgi:hypothetical protein
MENMKKTSLRPIIFYSGFLLPIILLIFAEIYYLKEYSIPLWILIIIVNLFVVLWLWLYIILYARKKLINWLYPDSK